MAAGFVGQVAAPGVARDPLCHLHLPITNHISPFPALPAMSTFSAFPSWHKPCSTKWYVDQLFRLTPSSNEPLVTTSVWVGVHDGYF
jgi:hypothetical protein